MKSQNLCIWFMKKDTKEAGTFDIKEKPNYNVYD